MRSDSSLILSVESRTAESGTTGEREWHLSGSWGIWI